ncbi:MAG: hydantoinase, partial [Nitrospinota bacterium]
MRVDLRIDGGALVLPGRGIVRAGLAVHGGKIAAIGKEESLPSARRSIDASGLHVLPGLVDPHGHMGLSGDFAGECETETRAALKGGVTTIGLFLRSEGDHLENIPKLAAEVDRNAFIDVFFTLIIGDSKQTEGIPRYAEELGVRSFKFYLWAVPGMKTVDDALLFRAFREIAALGKDVTACVHAENPEIINRATALA